MRETSIRFDSTPTNKSYIVFFLSVSPGFIMKFQQAKK